MQAPTSLEKFKAKHGQLAYNDLVKSAGVGKAKSDPLINSSLSQMTRRLMENPRKQLSAKSGNQPRIRGQADIPLNSSGVKQADGLSRTIAARGGVDTVVASPLQRSLHTAGAIVGKTNTPIHVDNRMLPWHQGVLQGQPEATSQQVVNKLTLEHADDPIPGGGESFNASKQRFLGKMLAPLMEAHAQDPSSKLLLLPHSQHISMAKQWIDAGARRDLGYKHDPEHSVEASLLHIYPNGPKWSADELKDDDMSPLKPGIYLGKHGETDWS